MGGFECVRAWLLAVCVCDGGSRVASNPNQCARSKQPSSGWVIELVWERVCVEGNGTRARLARNETQPKCIKLEDRTNNASVAEQPAASRRCPQKPEDPNSTPTPRSTD